MSIIQNLESLGEDEIAAIELAVRNERVRRKTVAHELRLARSEIEIVTCALRGYVNGLTWADRWGWNANPGGPWISGADDFEEEVSRIKNTRWREDFQIGLKRKKDLGISVPDDILMSRSDLEKILDFHMGALIRNYSAVDEDPFGLDEKVQVVEASPYGCMEIDAPTMSARYRNYVGRVGTVIHKVVTKHPTRTIYLVYFGSSLPLHESVRLFVSTQLGLPPCNIK
jgi:hypothetical protein